MAPSLTHRVFIFTSLLVAGIAVGAATASGQQPNPGDAIVGDWRPADPPRRPRPWALPLEAWEAKVTPRDKDKTP